MSIADEFDQFWRAFPRKTAKLAARKAYDKARKIATAADILAGVDRYRANKPAYADWCHPATFLSQGRWLDEYEPSASARQTTASDWWDECKALHGGTCTKRWDHETRMLDERHV